MNAFQGKHVSLLRTDGFSMTDTFPSIALQSALATGAILFGVFGFLYSVYAMFSLPSSPSNLGRPPIVGELKKWCRVIAILILVTSLLTLYSLAIINPAEPPNILLASGLVLITVAVTAISLLMAFRHMP